MESAAGNRGDAVHSRATRTVPARWRRWRQNPRAAALVTDALRMVDFFRGTDGAVLEQFLAAGRCAEWEKGHAVWKRGGRADGVVVPVTGELKTMARGADGREFIERFAGPGDWIGLQSSLDGLPHPTDAEVTRGGAFFHLGRKPLLALLVRHPKIRRRATTAVGMLYRQNVHDREDMVLLSVPRRLARFLLEQACVRQGDGAKILVHATQADVAARLGTVREVVARSLGDFASQGLISRTPHGMFIDRWDGLRAIAGDDGPRPEAATEAGPGVRTERFYLPLREDWGAGRGAEPTGCREHLGDLTPCERNGCPSAKDLREREEREDRRRAAARAPSA